MLRFLNKKPEDGHLCSGKGNAFGIRALELSRVVSLSGEVSRCLLIMMQGVVCVCVCVCSRNQIFMLERWCWISKGRNTFIKCDPQPKAKDWRSGW